MKPWLVLPVKSTAQGKSRLSPHFDPVARRELNLELLERSLALATCYPGLARTVVVSHCPEVLALARVQGARTLAEAGQGLNEGVTEAVNLLSDNRGQILVMSCDLPFARADDLRTLVREGEVIIATDRAGSGTNALSLPGGTPFRFQYGDDSRHLHAQEAARLGLPCRVLHGTSLAFDLDTFDDYREWRRLQEDLRWLPACFSAGSGQLASPWLPALPVAASLP